MKKKKELVKLSAMTLREISTITRIIGELQIECSKKAIPNTNGTYSHIVLKSIKPFVKEEIELIKKLFKKYCAAVKTGEADPIKLLAYCTMTKVLQFYEEELCILNYLFVF